MNITDEIFKILDSLEEERSQLEEESMNSSFPEEARYEGQEQMLDEVRRRISNLLALGITA